MQKEKSISRSEDMKRILKEVRQWWTDYINGEMVIEYDPNDEMDKLENLMQQIDIALDPEN